ncbi:concanavalin A-like lectin/glucanase domain-containing protein [Glomus cerebriforme]|uniref:Concanavalin A-like lectin/glucanase domain-containing protein n=1 Tax=Glomus cerebriforme TaxID=658196 RepID=A0A397SHS5_9GLOM|nr:concanavalin A-like lectin/glucanase domain-containing protein [Glomus cerebriforme]
MQSNSDIQVEPLKNILLFSDIKIKGNDGEELSAHRNILMARSGLFSILLNGTNEATQDLIFPEFSSDTLLIILEYLYTEKVAERLTIEIIAEAFHCADFFLIEQLKLQIIEFFKNYLQNNSENIINISAKILSQLLEYMESFDNEFASILYDSINSEPLKTIEYCNLNARALEYILSKIEKEETDVLSTSEYDIFRYITLWAANDISEEALSFYNSCLPSSEIVKNLNTTYLQEWKFNIPLNIQESHSNYQSMMMTKTSSLFNYVNLEQIHPLIISNIIEPLSGLISSNKLSDIRRRYASLAGKYIYMSREVPSLQWSTCGYNMCLYRSPFVVTSNSLSQGWVRTVVPVSGRGLVEWDIVVEKMCRQFWVGICTVKGFDVDYDSWLGKHEYGWVFGSNGFICHNTSNSIDRYGQNFNEKDKITVHLDMDERTCSFSVNERRYPVAFHNLPNEIYPAVSLCAPGKAKIEPH